MKFKIFFLISVKNWIGLFMGIALNLYLGWSLKFFKPFQSMSMGEGFFYNFDVFYFFFFSALKLYLYKQFISLFKFIPRFLGCYELIACFLCQYVCHLYRKANDSCVLIWCISCRNFLLDYVRSFMYRIISPTTKDNLISVFLMCILFISLTYLAVKL